MAVMVAPASGAAAMIAEADLMVRSLYKSRPFYFLYIVFVSISNGTSRHGVYFSSP